MSKRPGANRVGVVVMVGLAVFAVIILRFFPPERHVFYPRCALHSWTGLYCPGCGSLRALSLLTRGEIAAALKSNLLLTLTIPLMTGLLVLRRWKRGDWAVAAWVPIWGWWAGLGIVVLFGLVRNLPGPFFDRFHP